ncbi:MAG: hypothetical protein ACYCZX_11140 [Rhodospirillaceae bacterium]
MADSITSATNSTASQALTAKPASGILSTLPVTTTGSALLNTGGALTVLGASSADDASSLFGNISSTQSALFKQVQANASARIAEQLQAVDDVANSKLSALNLESDRWVSVKAQINNAAIYVSNGQDAANQVNQTLLDMRSSIANTAQQGEDPKYWKDQFNSQVTSINQLAESGTPASNLVGNLNPVDFSPNQIEYRNDLGVGTTTLTGTYIGTGFRITANDGTVWVPDMTTDLIQAYKGLQGAPETYTTVEGDKLNKATSTRNGMKLVSYDPKTKNITVDITVVPTEPPITVTGKLETSGIGIMQSWFYNDFATKADRDRAFTDISKAEVGIVSAQGDLARSEAQVGTDNRRATNALNQLGSATADATTDKQAKEQQVQIQAAQQYLAMQANLQNLQSVQSNYLQAFSGFIDDPFAQASLDLIA